MRSLDPAARTIASANGVVPVSFDLRVLEYLASAGSVVPARRSGQTGVDWMHHLDAHQA